MHVTIKPITVSGLYEHSDGTVGRYMWEGGQPSLRAIYPSWDLVESYSEYLEKMARPDENDRAASTHPLMENGYWLPR